MKITGNEPANPLSQFKSSELAHIEGAGVLTGLTIRQQFAAMAMQGILANPELGLVPYNKTAEMAVRQAEALLVELNKPTNDKQ